MTRSSWLSMGIARAAGPIPDLMRVDGVLKVVDVRIRIIAAPHKEMAWQHIHSSLRHTRKWPGGTSTG
jgi:hypothetical protein